MAVSRKELLLDLRAALRSAVDRERRFGIRDDCRSDCEASWDRVIEKMESLWRPTRKKSAAK
jgi:hypothetical protein